MRDSMQGGLETREPIVSDTDFRRATGKGWCCGHRSGKSTESVRNIATRHGLEVVIISVLVEEARIALCERSERSASA